MNVDAIDWHGQAKDGFKDGRSIGVAHSGLNDLGFSGFFGQGEQMGSGFLGFDFRDADLRRCFNHGKREGVEQHFFGI